MQRLRKAPRNWTYWIAGFTAANGLFLAMQHDFMVLAGLASPFAIPGATPHLIAAAAFGAIAYFSSRFPKLPILSLVVYVADMLFTAYVQLWSGLVMHLVVLVFVGFSFLSMRALKALQAQQSGVGA